MVYKSQTGLGSISLNERENACWQTAGFDGFYNCTCNQFGGTGMSGVTFTITGQPAARALAVSPPAVEKANGKLLAPKTTTGPSATREASQIRAGKGLAIRQRGVDPSIGPGAFADDFGEKAKLSDGASAFAGKAFEREAGLEVGALEKVVAQSEDFFGDFF